jgi:hypothetical protein
LGQGASRTTMLASRLCCPRRPCTVVRAILGDVSTRNLELTHQAFEAIHRRDLDWLVAYCDPGVEMHMRGVAGEPVGYVGAAGIREYLRDIAGDLGRRSSSCWRTSVTSAIASS